MPEIFQRVDVRDPKSYWYARQVVEKAKISQSHTWIEIVDQGSFELFKDIEVLGQGVTLVMNLTPRSELAEELLNLGVSAVVPSDFTDGVILKSSVLDRLDRFRTYMILAKQGNQKGSPSQWIREAVASTATEIALVSPSTHAEALDSARSIVAAIVESRINGTSGRMSAAAKLEPIANHVKEVFQQVVHLVPEMNAAMSLLRDAIFSGSVSDLVDSAMVFNVLETYFRSSQLFRSEIARRMGLGFLADLSINLKAIFEFQNSDELVQKAFGRWSRRSELEKRFAELAGDLTEVQATKDETKELGLAIEGLSGFLRTEFELVLTRLTRPLAVKDGRNLRGDLITSLASKFRPLSVADQSVSQTLSILADASKVNEGIVELKTRKPTSFEDWSSYCKDVMRTEKKVANVMSHFPDVESDFPDVAGLSEQRDALNNLVVASTARYEDWLVAEFPQMLTSATSPVNCHILSELRQTWQDGSRVVLLIIDGLRLDFWEIAREVFAEEGWVPETDRLTLSMLPSLTAVSRRCLAGGQAYSDLIELCKGRWQGISPQDESALVAMALGLDARQIRPIEDRDRKAWALSDSLVYCNDMRSFDWALSKGAGFSVLVYKPLDEISHGLEHEIQVHLEMMQTLFRDMARKVCRPLRADDATKIAIATDHGFLPTNFGSKIALPPQLKAGTSEYKTHQRLAVVSRVGSNPLPKVDEREFIVWRAGGPHDPAKYGLQLQWSPQPALGLDRIEMWVYPRGLNYFDREAGFYVHGGLSYFETIVPFAILNTSSGGVQALALEVEPRTILANNNNDITLTLRNPNRIQANSVRLALYDTSQEIIVDAIPPQSSSERVIRRRPTARGRYRLRYVIQCSIGGKSFETAGETEFRVDLSAEDARREKLSVRRDVDSLLGGLR